MRVFFGEKRNRSSRTTRATTATDAMDVTRGRTRKIKVDDDLVASHLYTDRQNHALTKGGIQRLYVGNVKSGKHEITAIFTGLGPDNREYTRGATMIFEKDEDPKMIEVRVRDSEANMQPKFDFKEWEL